MGEPSRVGENAVVAGISALVGQPLRALATTGLTLDRDFTVSRARVAYTTPRGSHAVMELDPARLLRLDTPVEPGWVRCLHTGPCAAGTVESLTLEVEPARARRSSLVA